MKTIIKYNLLVVLMIISGACSDRFLDEEILGVETLDSFYSSEENATKGVTALYSRLKIHGNRMLFGDIMSDDAWKGGENNADFQSWYDLLIFNIDPFNGTTTGMWIDSYNLIYEANVAILRIPDIDMDSDVKERLIAEARALRAFSYLELVRLYGGVPLITEPLTPDKLNIPRNSAEEIFTFIEDEFLAVSEILPSIYPASDHGRITKDTALGLLARIHLFQGEFAEVEKYTKMIIDRGVYGFHAEGFNGNWSLENYAGNIEFMFEVKSYGFEGFDIQTTRSLLAVQTGIRGSDTGWSFDIPTQDLYDAYEDGDPRREFTIGKNGDMYDNEDVLVIDSNIPAYGTDGDPYACIKWYETKSKRKNPKDIDHYMSKSFPILRYADVVLMYAEALNENGNSAGALIELNKIRERARNSVTPASAVPANLSIADQGGLRAAILNERRLELAFEWNRYFDLIRTKTAGTVLRNFASKYNTPKGAAFDETKHYLMPIPGIDITRTGGIIEQNPGY